MRANELPWGRSLAAGGESEVGVDVWRTDGCLGAPGAPETV